MTKITFLGAGSTVFAKNLLGDILSFPELAESTISLHDISEKRLGETEMVAHRIAEKLDVNPTIENYLDRQTRAYLPRRHARSAHHRGAIYRADL